MNYVLRQWSAGQISGICHHLERNRLPYRVLEAYESPRYPHAGPKDTIFALGGPPSVCRLHDPDYECTFLLEEARFLREALRAGAAFFGICLGHQLRARMDFHDVDAGHLVFGMEKVHLTDRGRSHWLFQGVPRSLHVYQAHRDRVRGVPRHVDLLASSDTCPVEAVGWDDRSVSTQFHPEVLVRDIPLALNKNPDALRQKGDTVEAMVSRVPADYAQATSRIFDNFLYRAGAIPRPHWIRALWPVPSRPPSKAAPRPAAENEPAA